VGTEIPYAKLQALREFTKAMIDHRGHVADKRPQNFLGAGFERRHALEVITGLAAKLISNYTNALAHTEHDEVLERFEWTHLSQR